uniref:hypothetical protein n=1 Tax=Okeania sp. SIO2F4 TaxID=2607790 RepID=UPI0025FF7797|nr:hypothetical protein [Okeania sp. SIO2F4]
MKNIKKVVEIPKDMTLKEMKKALAIGKLADGQDLPPQMQEWLKMFVEAMEQQDPPPTW